MKSLSDTFEKAAWDYLYLLDRHYPQKAILKIIGDRYRLSGVERSMLYRGICPSGDALRRKRRIVKLPESCPALHIDGYNVILTIGSYLNGNTVFIANDGFIRDASEIHGKAFRQPLLQRSVTLLHEYLLQLQPMNSFIYFDAPVSGSGELSASFNQFFSQTHLPGLAQTCHSADYLLKQAKEGFIITSDTAVVDSTELPLADLVHELLFSKYDPRIIDLTHFIIEEFNIV